VERHLCYVIKKLKPVQRYVAMYKLALHYAPYSGELIIDSLPGHRLSWQVGPTA
jgi:hypothetical protein